MFHDKDEAAIRLAAERAIAFRRRNAEGPQVPLQMFRQCLADFDGPLPETPGDPAMIIAELADKAEKGLQMNAGPRFFAWVMGASHPAGVAADFLTSAWGQNAGNHHVGPSAAAAEAVAARWLVELLDLPTGSSVGFTTGATAANMTCLAAARDAVLRAKGWEVETQGLFGAPPISVLIGEEAHTTVFAALQYIGLGRNRVIRIACDGQGRIKADAFAEALAATEGPLICILQAGQINTGDFDDFTSLIPLAKSKQAWVHVDGAFGLWARASGATKKLTAGIEEADSWATDGHKWLQTPYDCGLAFVRDELAHRRAMAIAASYLPRTEEGERDPSHYVPELSRRARGFAAWAVIKALGRSGIAAMVERHCRVARLMAEILSSEPGVRVENDVVLNQAIVRFGTDRGEAEGDRMTEDTIRQIQKDAVCYAASARWHGALVMRISVIGFDTDEAEGERSARAMIEAYRRVVTNLS